MPTLNTNLEPPRHMQVYQVENLSRDSPISTSMVTPTDSNGSPIVPGRGSIGNGDWNGFAATNGHHPHQGPATNGHNGLTVHNGHGGHNGHSSHIDGVRAVNGSRNGSTSSQAASSWSMAHASHSTNVDRRRSSLATEITPQPQPPPVTSDTSAAMRHLAAGMSHLVSSMTPTGNNMPAAPEDGPRNNEPYHGLDEDTLRALRAYVYNEPTNVEWDEDSLLLRIEAIWRKGVRSDYSIMLENIQSFVARDRAILMWIELKRHLADLDRADKRTYPCNAKSAPKERKMNGNTLLPSHC